ncbi:MAG TPA: phage holin family protein [Baekduia sp.]|nr:phage holin family protein [Baekduia sp.]
MTTHGDHPELRDQSIADLLKRLSQDTSTLVRQEMALARAELTEQGKRAGTGAGMLGGAGVAGLLTLGALTATAIGALDTAMAFWLAALIVTVVWAAIAGVLALQGRNKIKEATPPAPQTVETVKEDVRWAKTRT